MTTAYDITLQMMKYVADVLEGTATDGSATTLKDSVNLIQVNEFYDRGTVWIKSGTHAGKMARVKNHASQTLTFDPLGSVICVRQVETATVVGTVTGDGNAEVIVTAAMMPNSPKTLSVAVLNTDTASQVATKIRTALNADTDVKNFFTIGGSGADITLTTKVARANDTTINLSVDNDTCTGLTAAPTSANTTAGVAGPRYAVADHYWPMNQMLAKINAALDETHVTGEDTSLTGDGETLDFTLPTGVFDLKEVRFDKSNGETPPSHHWKEENGLLRFKYGYAPESVTIHIYYKKPHDEVTDYSTEIHTEINRDWLALIAARELLFWGAQMYGAKQYMIEDNLNKVMGMLKGKQPRIGGPGVMITTGG